MNWLVTFLGVIFIVTCSLIAADLALTLTGAYF